MISDADFRGAAVDAWQKARLRQPSNPSAQKMRGRLLADFNMEILRMETGGRGRVHYFKPNQRGLKKSWKTHEEVMKVRQLVRRLLHGDELADG
jgi:hypothetical protein